MTRRIYLLQCSVRRSFVIPNVNKSNLISNVLVRVCVRLVLVVDANSSECCVCVCVRTSRPASPTELNRTEAIEKKRQRLHKYFNLNLQ